MDADSPSSTPVNTPPSTPGSGTVARFTDSDTTPRNRFPYSPATNRYTYSPVPNRYNYSTMSLAPYNGNANNGNVNNGNVNTGNYQDRLSQLSWRLGAAETQLDERTRECDILRQEKDGMKSELDKCNEERRGLLQRNGILQAQSQILQNEILLLQGDIRFILHNPDKQPPPRNDNSPKKTPTPAAAPFSAAMASSTPGSNAATEQDIETTPTPSKAVPAMMMKFPTSANQAAMQVGPNTSSSSASNSGVSPMLRERASFQSGRVEDPFNKSLSRQTSRLSLRSQSSSTDLHGSPPKNRHSANRPASKALVSTNWRQQQPAELSQIEGLDSASLSDARSKYLQWLYTTERWADLYCGTIHTSVRSKEHRTAEMVQTLGYLVGNFDLEKVFNKLDTRTLLVTTHVNKTILEHLFGAKVLESFGNGEANARLRELGGLQDSTPTRNPARHRDIAAEKAEVFRSVVSSSGGEAFKQWREAEAGAMAADLTRLLTPIIPVADRNAAQGELRDIVTEAFRVVFAMRCLPRAWHLAFDDAGERVNTATMVIRNAELQGNVESAAATLEDEYAVKFCVTPHLVSKVWTAGGVAPEELLKAEVLVHAVGRSFFYQ